jgi:predicted GNAT family acetyltransferase
VDEEAIISQSQDQSEGVIIRQFRDHDEEEIVGFLGSVFNGWPQFDIRCSSLDHWRWKYEDNPPKLRSIAVAEGSGKIVGCSHGFYAKAKIGKKTLLVQQGTDLGVDNSFRGRGIHPRMTDNKIKDVIEKGANMSYSISGNPIVVRGDLKKKRPQFPSPLRYMIKIKDVDLHLRMAGSPDKLRKKYGYLGLKALSRVTKQMKTFKPPASNLEISPVERFDEKFEVFWNEVKEDYSFIVEREPKYLNWRYRDVRGGDFSVMKASEDGRILGYIVLRVNSYRKEYPEGYVADLLTLRGRIDAASALVNESERYFTSQGVNVAQAFTVKGHPHERLFGWANYLTSQTRYILFYTPYNVDEATLKEFETAPPSRLHFSYGDLDWI